jgi:hypothetical protein
MNQHDCIFCALFSEAISIEFPISSQFSNARCLSETARFWLSPGCSWIYSSKQDGDKAIAKESQGAMRPCRDQC